MPFDITGARSAGATDEDIIDHIRDNYSFDIDRALTAGASLEDIAGHVSKPAKIVEPVETPPVGLTAPSAPTVPLEHLLREKEPEPEPVVPERPVEEPAFKPAEPATTVTEIIPPEVREAPKIEEARPEPEPIPPPEPKEVPFEAPKTIGEAALGPALIKHGQFEIAGQPTVEDRIKSLAQKEEGIVKSFQSGDIGTDIDIMFFLSGAQKGKNNKELLELKDMFKRAQEQGGVDVDPGLLKKTARSVAGMAPGMIKGLGAMGIGSLASPGVGTAAGASYWVLQGAGQMYGDLIEAGVEPDKAWAISVPAGALYGAIESVQVGRLAGISKAVREQVRTIATKSLMESAQNFAKLHGKNWVRNVNEEVLQEWVTTAAQVIGEEGEGIIDKNAEEITREILGTTIPTLKEVSLPMLAIGLPAAAAQAPGIVSQQRQLAKEAPSVKPVIEPTPDVTPEPDKVTQPEIGEAKKTETIEEPKDKAPETPGVGVVSEDIIKPLDRLEREMQETEGPKHKASLQRERILSEDERIPRAVKEPIFKESIQSLDKEEIPYSYVRIDGRNLTGANEEIGHTKTDQAMTTAWGLMQQEIENNGGLLSRFGAKSDEMAIVFPNKSVEQVEKIMQGISKNVEAKVKELGLDKTKHFKLKIPEYGSLSIDYGITEGLPGKFGEMDSEADALAKVEKLKIEKAKAAEKNYIYNEEQGIYVPRKTNEKPGVIPKEPPGQGVGKVGETPKPEGKPEGKAGVTEKIPPVTPPRKPKVTLPEEETVGLNKREITHIREAIGETPLTPVEKKTFNTSLTEAKVNKVDEGAVSIADEVLQSKRQMTDTEHAGMVLKAGQLKDEFNNVTKTISELQDKGDPAAAQREIERREVIADELERITKASDLAGRETARALSIRRMMLKMEDYSLAGVTQQARALKGKKLTAQETQKFQKMTEDYSRLEKNFDELNKKYNEERIAKDKLLAESITRIVRRKPAKFEEILDERKQIEKELSALGFRVNDITGLTTEGSYLVGKLAVNYIKETAATVKGKIELNDIIKKVKEKVPDLSDQDVYQALISKDPKRQAKAKSDTQKQIARLKTQSKLLVEIDEASKGIVKPKKDAPPKPKEIRDLQFKLKDLRKDIYDSGLRAKKLERSVQTINELQDQLAYQYRAVKKKPTEIAPELGVAREKIQQLRREIKIEDEMADLEEQLKTGDFKIVEKPLPRQLPQRLEQAEIMLARKRKEVRNAIQSMGPLTKKRIMGEVVGLPRALQSTGDMSGWLRQNIVQVLAHPIKAAKLLPITTKAFFSEYQADKVDQAIKNSPNFYLYDKSKLEIRELDGIPSKREETFHSNLAEKIPLLGRVVRASNRNMVTVGNLLRTTLFDDFLVKFPNATHEELSAYADILNITTGIGNLKKFATTADTWGLLFYAPKLAVSRFQTPYLLAKYWSLPRVRKQYAKELLRFVGTGITILNLTEILSEDDENIDVSSDPRSPDFGKIRVGNTRFDLWGGFQQPARLVSRIAIGATDKIGITGRMIPEEDKEVDPMELIWRFTAFKLSPFITASRTLYTGKTPVGEKVTPTEAIAKTFTTLTLQDIIEAQKEAGPKRAVLAGSAVWFGIGVNTYGHSYKRVLQVQRRYKKLKKEDEKRAKEFKNENKQVLRKSIVDRAKKIDKEIKLLEMRRKKFEEKENKKRIERMDERIEDKIVDFELFFNRRMKK